MPLTAESSSGMVVSPHHTASKIGLAVLRQGGNAVEAVVAAAAALCVCYPHMTGLGGDGFWMILPAGEKAPFFIDACGRSARAVSPQWHKDKGLNQAVKRGPLAALTMAGAVSGWAAALDLAASFQSSPLALPDILGPATDLAEQGFPVSASQARMTKAALAELKDQPGFAGQFLNNGQAPACGAIHKFPALARTFCRLAKDGLASFYQGNLAREMAGELQEAGSPLGLEDFAAHTAEMRAPLSLRLNGATLFNSPPPTQGVASLIILGLFERLAGKDADVLRDEARMVHALVEATKQAFMIRDRSVADPACMTDSCADFLKPGLLDSLAENISLEKALPWPQAAPGGDTVWMGAVDSRGNAVSYIQSIYHEFGSGLVLPATGVTWHNRGLGFTLEPGKPNSLAPGKKPFHTLNPALAILDDGRIVPYGTMGGEGQPQTQAAVFCRYFYQGKTLHQAVSEPRWLLGRSWGDQSANLKLEKGFPPDIVQRLESLGHEVETVPARSSLMGHAGVLVLFPDGRIQGASDPRSDGLAAG